MKLTSFVGKDGIKSFGIYHDAGIVDLGRRLGDRFVDIKALLAADALDEARAFQDCAVDHALAEVRFLPIVETPGKILCVGMNYAAKRKEFEETNSAPTMFVRFPDSQTGHACPVLKPEQTEEFDYEGELAVVIGKAGFRVKREKALEHVAGYSCYMDGSVRDWQHTWFTAGKNWRQTGAFGPWMVTTDEIADPQTLTIRTFLNGMMVQDDHTGNMIHTVPELIEYITTFTELAPGDVIITGSPGGVGKKRVPPLFLKDGDVVEVEIQKIGRLQNTVLCEEYAA
ncbi:fumarylacetoacetate hydrolase family protein [Paludibacterium yongneupense]|uniref:fumarylacetoacetate hydrolase family protein n=1 Tax=Paludibacterium yongneupense TaxID=400061 RepID=UPI00041C425B|nr:fumarylacetoacetate hydrolase family protein [Paludibacterium yongneupense]